MAKPNPKTAPVLALLQEARLSVEEIAKVTGVSVNVVYGVNAVFKQVKYKVYTRRAKEPRPPSPRTDRGLDLLLGLYLWRHLPRSDDRHTAARAFAQFTQQHGLDARTPLAPSRGNAIRFTPRWPSTWKLDEALW